MTELLWLPLIVGVKTTGTLQLPAAASSGPQEPEPTLKGGAAAEGKASIRVPRPGLVTVSCWAALLEPTATTIRR